MRKVLSNKLILLFLIVVFSLQNELKAQSNSKDQKPSQIPSQIPTRQDEFYKMIEEMRARHRDLVRGLLNDQEDFGDLFKQMEERLNAQGFGNVFENRFNPVVGEYDWLEDESSRTLKLKVTQIKDKPLEIKVEKKMLSIKGNVESVSETPKGKSRSVVYFERSFSIPDDVDSENPSFENKNGEFLIKFPKLKNTVLKKGLSAPRVKPEKTPSAVPTRPTSEEERVPIDPNETDISL